MAQTPFRQKVYVEGSQRGIDVPFTEVVLGGGERSVRLYDTSGPGSDPDLGLPPLRLSWITGRGDVEVLTQARAATLRDDGRAAVRRGSAAPEMLTEPRPPLRAEAGRRVTQLHY
ncbi:MAG TPA: phosphomethylpyrimidine synthase ThiC, partial [Acidimicrobiia bacterium]|nr:phosphomethylpyrimidine synthase ThiC [Acidimicrobiia bacterium]